MLIANKTTCKREVAAVAVQINRTVRCVAKEKVCANAVTNQATASNRTRFQISVFANTCVNREVVKADAVEQAATLYGEIGIYCTEQTNVVRIVGVNREVGNRISFHFTRFTIRKTGETTAKIGVFGGKVTDDFQFLAAAIDVVCKHVCARNVGINALINLFCYVEKVDGAADHVSIVECTRALHAGNFFLHACDRNDGILGKLHVIYAVVVGKNGFTVYRYDGIARVEYAHFDTKAQNVACIHRRTR